MPNTTRYILFVAIGFSLVVLSALFARSEQDLAGAITLNLGIIVLAVVVVDYVWRISGGHPMDQQISTLATELKRLSTSVDLIETSKKVGLEAAYDRMGNFGTQADWVALISGARESVDLMGRTMHGWTRAAELKDLIVSKITKDKVRFRWLIMDRDNRYLPLLTEEGVSVSRMVEEKLGIVHGFLRSLHDALPDGYEDYLQVRLFSHVPLYCSILRIDQRFYIMQYLYAQDSNDAPFFCIEGPYTAWAATFSGEFDIVWQNASVMSWGDGVVVPEE